MKRQRATCIVETEKGIPLVPTPNHELLLPGGGIEPGETPLEAAIRELEEEIDLVTTKANLLFTHETEYHINFVYLCQVTGIVKARNEIDYVVYYKPGREKFVHPNTLSMINRYKDMSTDFLSQSLYHKFLNRSYRSLKKSLR